MPRGNGTGPLGLGAKTGRGNGRCQTDSNQTIAGFILRLIIDNWKPILGIVVAVILPRLRKNMLAIKDNDDTKTILISAAK